MAWVVGRDRGGEGEGAGGSGEGKLEVSAGLVYKGKRGFLDRVRVIWIRRMYVSGGCSVCSSVVAIAKE